MKLHLNNLKAHGILDNIKDDPEYPNERVETAQEWLDTLVHCTENSKVYVKERIHQGCIKPCKDEKGDVIAFKNMDRKWSVYEFLKMFFDKELYIQRLDDLYDYLNDLK